MCCFIDFLWLHHTQCAAMVIICAERGAAWRVELLMTMAVIMLVLAALVVLLRTCELM